MLPLADIPPFLRVLLVTDGTVTKSLEAYFLEPIDVVVLTHQQMKSDRAYPQIEVVSGEPVVRRRVLLRGKDTRTAYAAAESVFATERLLPAVRHDLLNGQKGIGEILSKGRVESYRELLDVRQAKAGDAGLGLGVERSATVLVRRYRIYLRGGAAIQIEEVFPVERFGDSAAAPEHA